MDDIHPLIAILLATAFFASCSKDDIYEKNNIVKVQNEKSAEQVEFTGEELFRGIFFGSNINIPYY